jgi:hypothetical protein
MLIYIVSLTLQSVMKVTINNQCSNIELAYPAYFTKNTTCHGHLPQQVGSESIRKANFIIGIDRERFSGVLLYHLQRKKNDESNNRIDKDTATITQLLVIWEFRIDRLYSYVWLVEHENTLIWSEDNLERLYHVYNSKNSTNIILNVGKWLLDNNTKLQTVCEALYERDLEVNIIISEEKDLSDPIRPLWIDLDR